MWRKFVLILITAIALLEHCRCDETDLYSSPEKADDSNPESGLYSQIDCSAGSFTDEKNNGSHRFTLVDPDSLNSSCSAIRRRNTFAIRPRSVAERNFPILFVRILYRDYLYTEMSLALAYQPQNYYCFLVDSKADRLFKERMAKMGDCFPNVVVILSRLSISSYGANMTSAYIECFREMSNFRWKYAITLQYDFILRANWELVEILRLLNGSTHMEMAPGYTERINPNFSWKISSLQLIDEKTCIKIHRAVFAETRSYSFPAKCDRELQFAKGDVQMLLARRFVDFVLYNLNVSKMISQLETQTWTDEMFWPTINYDPVLQAPGGFPRRCLNDKFPPRKLTRFDTWDTGNKVFDRYRCLSKRWRHRLCIYGVEDMQRLLTRPHVLVNKIIPAFDASPAICLGKEIRRRQVAGREAGEREFLEIKAEYEKLVEIRYAKWIAAGNNESSFRCCPVCYALIHTAARPRLFFGGK